MPARRPAWVPSCLTPGVVFVVAGIVLAGCATAPTMGGTVEPSLVPGVLVVPASNHVTGTYPTTCHRAPSDDVRLPVRACTPGSIRSDIDPHHLELTVCKPGWSQGARPPTTETQRLKTVAMAAYGVPASLRDRTEFDHEVPEADGGSSDTTNLWPEVSTRPTGFRNDKDDVEDHVHAAICSHRGDPVAMERIWSIAVRAMATDWTTAERKLGIAPVPRGDPQAGRRALRGGPSDG